MWVQCVADYTAKERSVRKMIDMAREAGMTGLESGGLFDNFLVLEELVRADERNACADIVEDEIKRVKPTYSPTADVILRRIRERGQA